MQSNNPVFRSDAFRKPASSNAYGNQTYPGSGPYQGYGDPSQWGTGYPQSPQQAPPATTGPMTIDSVVQKSAVTLGLVILAAAATWFLTPDISVSNPAALGPLYLAITVGSLGAFVLSMVNSFKRVVSPALVLAFAVLEGVALGAWSKWIDGMFVGDHLVVQAVLGTFAAFAGTLAAYKFFNIKVGQKFRTFVMAAVFGMVGLSVLELVLSLFNAQLGLFGFGTLGLISAIVGLVLGVFMLILDFDFIEQSIAYGVEERESWRAAFALTVSLVWIYTNLLRLLAIFSQD